MPNKKINPWKDAAWVINPSAYALLKELIESLTLPATTNNKH